MENNTVQKVLDLINQNIEISILIGTNHSIDDMAAALSLFLAIQQMNKKVLVATPRDPLVGVSFLVGIDKVKKELISEDGDLTVSFPYNEGEVEKVSYKIEKGNLNIVIKAGESGLSFSEADVRYKRGGGVSSLIFIIGTPRLKDLEHLFNMEALRGVTVVNIDNKVENQGFGDIVLVSPQFSSVSEQVASLIVSSGIDMDNDMAQNLFDGIASETENFQKQSTSYLAFEIAGILMRKNINRTRIMEQISPRAFVDPVFQPSQSFPQSIRQQPLPQQDLHQPQLRHQQYEPIQQLIQDNKGRKNSQQQVKSPPDDWLTPKIYKGSTEL